MFEFFDKAGKVISGIVQAERFTPDGSYTGEVYDNSGNYLGYSNRGSSVDVEPSKGWDPSDYGGGNGLAGLFFLFLFLVGLVIKLALNFTSWLLKVTHIGYRMIKDGQKVGWAYLVPMGTVLTTVIGLFVYAGINTYQENQKKLFYEQAVASVAATQAARPTQVRAETPEEEVTRVLPILDEYVEMVKVGEPYYTEQEALMQDYYIYSRLKRNVLQFESSSCSVESLGPSSSVKATCMIESPDGIGRPRTAVNPCLILYYIGDRRSNTSGNQAPEWAFCETGFYHYQLPPK